MQKRHARFRKSAFYPKPDGSVELHPSVLHQFGDFPTGDDADPEDAVRATFEKLTVPRLQPIRPRNPPDPNVGVQQNHRRASQSWLATGSNGSWYSRTEPRRLWLPVSFDPEVFGTTNTSTGWPGSNGRPFKTSSPYSPTVVSRQCACTPPADDSLRRARWDTRRSGIFALAFHGSSPRWTLKLPPTDLGRTSG